MHYTETETALLKAVVANPADDLPRLMLCDELEANATTVREDCPNCRGQCVTGRVEGYGSMMENRCWKCHGSGGQWVADGRKERAEFIRVQCEMARRDREGIAGQRAAQLRYREQMLLGRNVSEDARTVCPQFYTWLDGLDSRFVRARGFGFGADCTPEEQSFDRGFVARVWCRLADWIGGECGRCDGSGAVEDFEPHHIDPTGRWLGSNGSVDCPDCSGTGRTPGIGPAVVAAHPLDRVVLTDRNPEQDRGQWGYPFVGDEDSIPDIILSPFNWGYESEEEARKFVSDAALMWAKSHSFCETK